MGFDDGTLEPTYVLRVGAPGKSAGLEIASRLGLPEELIDRARQRMSTSERDVSEFLQELHRRLDRAVESEQDLRRQQQSLATREQSLGKEFEQREARKFKELDERLQAALAEFESESRETIQKVLASAEQRKAAEQAERRVAKTKREFEQKARSAVFGEAPAAQPFAAIEEGARCGLKRRARTRSRAAETGGAGGCSKWRPG